jgi:hypothetical protein
MALEARQVLQGHAMYALRIVERIESLKIVSQSISPREGSRSRAGYAGGDTDVIAHQWEVQHSWVPEFMSALEGWLRVWGRQEDADTSRGQMEELMGEDDIDE